MNVLLQALDNYAAKQPDKIAIICNGREFSYAELWQDAMTLATHLTTYRQKTLAILYPNCYEFVCLYLASFMVEAIIVPINYRLTPPEIQSRLKHSEATLMLLHEDRSDEMQNLYSWYICNKYDR